MQAATRATHRQRSARHQCRDTRADPVLSARVIGETRADGSSKIGARPGALGDVEHDGCVYRSRLVDDAIDSGSAVAGSEGDPYSISARTPSGIPRLAGGRGLGTRRNRRLRSGDVPQHDQCGGEHSSTHGCLAGCWPAAPVKPRKAQLPREALSIPARAAGARPAAIRSVRQAALRFPRSSTATKTLR